MSSDHFHENIIYICKSLIKWKDHPKHGRGRYEDDLVKYQEIWSWLTSLVKELENMNIEEQEVKDFINLVKYKGDLYRYHIKFDKSDERYGIRESNNYISWTKSDSPLAFYWAYEGKEYLRIKSLSTNECFGIDLVGFSKYIQKYYDENYSIGSPAITKEQEVVFPLIMDLVEEIAIVRK